MVVPVDIIKSSGELVGALFFQGVFGPQVGGVLLPLAVALSAVGNVMVVTFAMVGYRPSLSNLGGLRSNTPVPVSSQAGDRPTRISPLLHSSIIDQTVWVSVGRPSRPLHPISACDTSAAFPGCLLVHPRSRRVSRTVCRYRAGRGPDLASIQAAGTREAVQGLAPGGGAPTSPEHFPARRTVLPSRQSSTWNLLRDLRYRWFRHVCHRPYPRSRSCLTADDTHRIVSGIVYWYIWTVAVPRLKGYVLEEEADILDDGTSITKLIRVPRESSL